MTAARLAVVTAVAVGFSAHPAHSVPINLLQNPGFETGAFTGWTVGGSAAGGVGTAGTAIPASAPPATVIVHSGSFAAYAAVANLATPDFHLDLSQTLTLAPGSYDISWWNGSNSPGALLFGGTGNFVTVNGTSYFTDQAFIPGNGYLERTIDDIVIVGGPTTILFHLSGSGGDRAGISFDDFSLTAVDEPPALLTFAAALVFLTMFGRHRRAAR
jgi:hypothetical protein